MISLIVLIYGIIIGSFLNVCIYRIPKEESIVYPPSHCGKCNQKLNWKDLIPIVSYIILKGKCRYCGEKVSYRYMVVEAFTGLMFLIIYMKYGLTFTFIKYFIAVCFMIVIGLIDFDTMDVYSKTTYSGIFVAMVFAIIDILKYGGQVTDYLIAISITAVIFGIIVYGIKGMGSGDLDIAILGSLFLGWKLTIFMVISSFILGGIIGVFLIGTKRKLKSDVIPFGPFLTTSFFLTIFIGGYVVERYQAMILQIL